jgi:hypothetical protein
MQRLGFAFFLVGVIVASWYAARFVPDSSIRGSGENGAITSMDRLGAWGSVAGLPFGGGAVLMVVGGVIARRARGRRIHVGGGAAAGTAQVDTGAMLREIEAAVEALPRGEPETCADQLRHGLDNILEDLIPAFIEQRQHHAMNLGGTFVVMNSSFASAERALSRAWSALTDEAWPEVQPCLAIARQSMASALQVAGGAA